MVEINDDAKRPEQRSCLSESLQDMLDSVDISALMREFSSRCDARLKLFGRCMALIIKLKWSVDSALI